MSASKIVALVVLAYLGVVVAFESLIGTIQPKAGSFLVITTFDADGTPHDRVDAEHPLGLGFRIVTGFPPRYFLRLDPRQAQAP